MKRKEHFERRLFQIVQGFDVFRGPISKFLANLLEIGGRADDLELLAENQVALSDAIQAARGWVRTRLDRELRRVLPIDQKPNTVSIRFLDENEALKWLVHVPDHRGQQVLASYYRSQQTTGKIEAVEFTLRSHEQEETRHYYYKLYVRIPRVEPDGVHGEWHWDLWSGHYLIYAGCFPAYHVMIDEVRRRLTFSVATSSLYQPIQR